MKWFFSIILGIFALFLGVCLVGFFLPETLSVERSSTVEAYAEDVFPYLNDLDNYRGWAALDKRLDNTTIVSGGSEEGVGQKQIWQEGPAGFEFGSREIVQSQSNEFVQIDVNIMGRAISVTYAIFDNGDGTVTVLSKREMEQPGFPYLGRIKNMRRNSGLTEDLDASLSRLKLLVESNL